MPKNYSNILTRSQAQKTIIKDDLEGYNSASDEDYNPMEDIDDMNGSASETESEHSINSYDSENQTDESLDEFGNVKDLIDYNENDGEEITNILTSYIVKNLNSRIHEELIGEDVEYELDDEMDLGDGMTSKSNKDKIKYKISKDKNDILYFNKLSPEEKHNILDLETSIKNLNTSIIPLRFRILESGLDLHIKANAIRKLDTLKRMDMSANEYHKIKSWIDGLLNIPFGVYKQIPISRKNNFGEINNYLVESQNHLDSSVYGHKSAKCHIIQIISQWISNPNSIGNVLAIHGPMGIGKTTLVKKGIAKALNKPYAFISLGGSTDSSYLEGHSYTYEGSQPGRIVDILTKAKCMNPIIYFDELDKVSDTPKGEEIINLLVHMTDSSQNSHFQDKYYSGINLDLSRCLFIFSYNNPEKINPILSDRMYKIKLDKFTPKDKIIIARKHLIKDICSNFNITKEHILFSDENIEYIVSKYTDEHGVRTLRRAIETIISKLNILLLTNNEHKLDLSYNIDKMVLPIKLHNKLIDSLLVSNDSIGVPSSMMYT